jgi:hypothetical protein
MNSIRSAREFEQTQRGDVTAATASRAPSMMRTSARSLRSTRSSARSISEAWNLASSDLGNIFVILLVAALLSLFTCGIGAPIGYIALAYVYKGKRGEAVAA